MINGMRWLVVFTFDGDDDKEWVHTHLSSVPTRQGAVEEARLHLTGMQLRQVRLIETVGVDSFEKYQVD